MLLLVVHGPKGSLAEEYVKWMPRDWNGRDPRAWLMGHCSYGDQKDKKVLLAKPDEILTIKTPQLLPARNVFELMKQWDPDELARVGTAKMIVVIWETDAPDIETRRTVTMFESQAAVSFIRTAVVMGLRLLSFKQIMYVTVLGSIQMNTNEMREFKTLVDLKPFGQPQLRPRDTDADSVFNLLVGLIRETELVKRIVSTNVKYYWGRVRKWARFLSHVAIGINFFNNWYVWYVTGKRLGKSFAERQRERVAFRCATSRVNVMTHRHRELEMRSRLEPGTNPTFAHMQPATEQDVFMMPFLGITAATPQMQEYLTFEREGDATKVNGFFMLQYFEDTMCDTNGRSSQHMTIKLEQWCGIETLKIAPTIAACLPMRLYQSHHFVTMSPLPPPEDPDPDPMIFMLVEGYEMRTGALSGLCASSFDYLTYPLDCDIGLTVQRAFKADNGVFLYTKNSEIKYSAEIKIQWSRNVEMMSEAPEFILTTRPTVKMFDPVYYQLPYMPAGRDSAMHAGIDVPEDCYGENMCPPYLYYQLWHLRSVMNVGQPRPMQFDDLKSGKLSFNDLLQHHTNPNRFYKRSITDLADKFEWMSFRCAHKLCMFTWRCDWVRTHRENLPINSQTDPHIVVAVGGYNPVDHVSVADAFINFFAAPAPAQFVEVINGDTYVEPVGEASAGELMLAMCVA